MFKDAVNVLSSHQLGQLSEEMERVTYVLLKSGPKTIKELVEKVKDESGQLTLRTTSFCRQAQAMYVATQRTYGGPGKYRKRIDSTVSKLFSEDSQHHKKKGSIANAKENWRKGMLDIICYACYGCYACCGL